MAKRLLIILALFLSTLAQPAMPPWPQSVFYQDISNAALSPNSNKIIANMKASSAAGSGAASGLAWGSLTGNLNADTNSFMPLWIKSGEPYYCYIVAGNAANPAESGPDCDDVSSGKIMFPLPVQGAIEGTNGYGSCSGDCYVTVYDEPNQLIWESYSTSISGNVLTSDCVVIWDLTQNYPYNLRGDQCMSCDSSGMPIGPLLATADEVSSGVISHALRFVLPNDMLEKGVYGHPATHATDDLLGPFPSPYFGIRMRLKQSFNISSFSNPTNSTLSALKVIFTAMKTYGMFMSDGGSYGAGATPLILAGDKFSTAKWSKFGIDYLSFNSLTVDDFEVVQVLNPIGGINGSGLVSLTFDCVRNFPTPVRANLTCSLGSYKGNGTYFVFTGSAVNTASLTQLLVISFIIRMLL